MVVDLSVDSQGNAAIFVQERLGATVYAMVRSPSDNLLVRTPKLTNTDDTQTLVDKDYTDQ